MAVQAAQAAGLSSSRHIHGGIQAWKEAAGPLVK
jgi:rhodanese-related sulfurtransferase